MTPRRNGIGGKGRRGRPAMAFALLSLLLQAFPANVSAQLFTDRPPPVPPASVPEAPGGAMSLAPSSGPISTPSLPAPLTQPPIAAIPPVVPPPGASTAGQAVLSLTARYGKDMPVITGGLVWRVFSDRPDETGTFKMVREDHGATPNIVLPAGGLRIEGRVGTTKIPTNQISFAIYKGSQFETTERPALLPSVSPGDVALLQEGTYYIVSNYGDANSVVRSDIRV